MVPPWIPRVSVNGVCTICRPLHRTPFRIQEPVARQERLLLRLWISERGVHDSPCHRQRSNDYRNIHATLRRGMLFSLEWWLRANNPRITTGGGKVSSPAAAAQSGSLSTAFGTTFSSCM